jgi:hypothetical protein
VHKDACLFLLVYCRATLSISMNGVYGMNDLNNVSEMAGKE